MNDTPYGKIVADGLWYNNAALVQLLGLCPLLAISGTVVNALGLGLATTLTLIASNVSVSFIRNWVRPEIRIPIYVLIIASVVTAIELAMNAYFHELYLVLGIFIPLIVTNCAIIGRAEAFASKHTIPKAFVDGLIMGIGFTLVLVALGGMREAIGQGTLFDQAHLMFGEAARGLTVTLIEDYRGFLLAILPPGAFIGLGLLLAVKNLVDDRLAKRAARRAEALGEARA
ncbi:electron transport complex subunit E [Ectothiorhodospira shaposhnikovii]|uniref:electron transport complex subunit E n=1 Tax=Ectothiorhodospira shaposhnikovii TaxID=1054 RepID=UPI001EE9ACD9|nr:electron transport complex subunit E [Ectothiorhodospira shaposhnikovii]MCG5513889.1 electron transport complex subunit E [Ectothiorhodospira shaposhnikovii]